MAERAYLGLGANLGDRLGTLQRAVDLLAEHARIRVLRCSRVYETQPVGGPPVQPDFLNAVIEIETELEPDVLLRVCQGVEGELGREREVRWGPRTMDVDILTYGRRTIDVPSITVPHPRMHERGFVMVPLLELDDDPPLPGGRRVATMRLSGSFEGVRLFAPPLAVAGLP